MTREVEARFERIERNLEQATRTMNNTAAINAETALLAKQNEEAIGKIAQLAKQNEQGMKRLITLVEVFVKGRSNGKSK